jgi:5-methyltetrahydropteroyltriglutamate--homocysteine methyltransferase
MKRSTDRILTTHVGSLPRPDDLCAMLLAKEKGEQVDAGAFDALVSKAVQAVVRRQVEAGVDIVCDGEMAKPGYATYIKDRLTGFSGDSPRRPPADLALYPAYLKKIHAAGETPSIIRQRCTGPVAVRDRKPLADDLARLDTAVKEAKPAAGAFMTAASPGVIANFQPNEFYPSHEKYLAALAEAMRGEYEAITRAGYVLQVDCPDLAMGRHIMFAQETDEGFLKFAAQNVEALNHALANVPAEQVRMHLCWGNYEGPHVCDIPLAKILGTVLKAKPQGISFEASNPRHGHEWAVFKETRIPDDKILLPGVIDSVSNFVEHPEYVAERIGRFADIVGRERVIASSDCGFGTFAGFGKVDSDITYAKLKTLAEGAAIASRRLWG